MTSKVLFFSLIVVINDLRQFNSLFLAFRIQNKRIVTRTLTFSDTVVRGALKRWILKVQL